MVVRPLHRSRWAAARWLILAPHPDDEVIGAGALLSISARAGELGAVVFLTDGAASHGPRTGAERMALAAARRAEAALGMRRLTGGPAPRMVHLDWPDAHPRAAGEPEFENSVRQVAALCRRLTIDAIAVTAGHEPHCDHEAACMLARAAAQRAGRPVEVFEYLVWAQHPPVAGYEAWRTANMPPGRRRLALAAHRSQLTPAFGEGFRLPPERCRAAPCDLLYRRRRRHG